MNMLPPNPVAPPHIKSDSSFIVLMRVVEAFPKFLYEFIVLMLVASLSDTISFALTLLAIGVGLVAGSWLVALTTFFGVYVLIRTVNNLAAAIGQSGGAIGGAVQALALIYRDRTQPPQQ